MGDSKKNISSMIYNVFNEERINKIRDVINGSNHLLLFKAQVEKKEKLEKIGFVFYDIPSDELFWDVELPEGWYNELLLSSPTGFTVRLIDSSGNEMGKAYCYMQGLNTIAEINLDSYNMKNYRKRHNP